MGVRGWGGGGDGHEAWGLSAPPKASKTSGAGSPRRPGPRPERSFVNFCRPLSLLLHIPFGSVASALTGLRVRTPIGPVGQEAGSRRPFSPRASRSTPRWISGAEDSRASGLRL